MKSKSTDRPWTYSRYRATLKKDGKTFAIVTPDGRNALALADEERLLSALNSEQTLDTVLHDVDYEGGLQYWIARYEALFLKFLKARGVITPSSGKTSRKSRAKPELCFHCWALPMRFSEGEDGRDLDHVFDRYYVCAPHETKKMIKETFPDSSKKLVRLKITLA